MTDELDAMRALREAIEPLDAEQRQRAVKWLSTYVADESGDNRQGRIVSSKWRAILAAMHNAGGSGTYDDLAKWAATEGYEVNRGQLRAQVHVYLGNGLMAKGDDGTFLLTEAGVSAAGI